MRIIAILAGAAMAASAFLNWVSMPFAGGFTPYDALRPALGPDAPLEVLLYAGTFALGGLAGLVALLSTPSRLLNFIAGAAPFALAVWNQMQAQDALDQVGLSLWDFSDGIGAAMNRMMEFVDIGFYAYWGGAVLLLIAALAGGGGRRYRRDDAI